MIDKLYFAKSGYVLFLFLMDGLLLSQRLLVRGTLRFTDKTSKLVLYACFEKNVVSILSICLCFLMNHCAIWEPSPCFVNFLPEIT